MIWWLHVQIIKSQIYEYLCFHQWSIIFNKLLYQKTNPRSDFCSLSNSYYPNPFFFESLTTKWYLFKYMQQTSGHQKIIMKKKISHILIILINIKKWTFSQEQKKTCTWIQYLFFLNLSKNGHHPWEWIITIK